MGFFDHLLRDICSVIDPDGGQNAIPSLDGAFSSNDRLDNSTVLGDPLPDVDDVIADGSAVYASAGNRVLKLSGPNLEVRTLVAEFEGPAGGLAVHPDGRLLVCVGGRGLAAIDPARPNTRWLEAADGRALSGLLSVAATPDGRIFAVEGSAGRTPDQWCRDLMEKRRQGRLIVCGPDLANPSVLLRDLAYPYGLAISADGNGLWLSESWAHRLSYFELTGTGLAQGKIVAANLPGYPARLHSDGSSGFLLGFFARRTHLIEFVLKEDDFRKEMMRTMPQNYWVAPAFAGGGDCLEPMQYGGIRALGIQKPWAPPRSYGLLVHLDAEGAATDSLHSRAGGRFHGVTGGCKVPEGLAIAVRGSGCLVLHKGEFK